MEKIKPKKHRRGKLIHIRLSPRLHLKLKIHVVEKGTTFQAWISRAIRRELRSQRALTAIKKPLANDLQESTLSLVKSVKP